MAKNTTWKICQLVRNIIDNFRINFFDRHNLDPNLRKKRQSSLEKKSQLRQMQKLSLFFNPIYIALMRQHGSIKNNPKMQTLLSNRFKSINPILARNMLNYDKIYDAEI
ncbi:hypothetical protein BpHYR1_023407 [Brachionus plicatilis]|uniref:Uncharacterized protein n=1 Tax=Brachionus plicatilis TaxID=10195 RepID=A0A3M7QZ10_BRAPC|nr:hypothetical protein BpHYR1_023407 [Brachionus plicatilis]